MIEKAVLAAALIGFFIFGFICGAGYGTYAATKWIVDKGISFAIKYNIIDLNVTATELTTMIDKYKHHIDTYLEVGNASLLHN